MVLKFWLLQPKFVFNLFLFLWAIWKDEKSKQKDKELKNNADRLYSYLRFLTSVNMCFIWDNQ